MFTKRYPRSSLVLAATSSARPAMSAQVKFVCDFLTSRRRLCWPKVKSAAPSSAFRARHPHGREAGRIGNVGRIGRAVVAVNQL